MIGNCKGLSVFSRGKRKKELQPSAQIFNQPLTHGEKGNSLKGHTQMVMK